MRCPRFQCSGTIAAFRPNGVDCRWAPLLDANGSPHPRVDAALKAMQARGKVQFYSGAWRQSSQSGTSPDCIPVLPPGVPTLAVR